MESEDGEIASGELAKASEKYSEQVGFRAAIQLIPHVGGALDTLLAGKGSRIQQQRIQDFLSHLNSRLDKIEEKEQLESSEEFYDLVLSVFDGVVRTRSEEKRARFASIVANKVGTEASWEEAETATRILKDLEELHIRVLLFAVEAPACDAPFNKLSVVTLSDTHLGGANIAAQFPALTVEALRMICSELVSRGLLYDEGVGRWNAKAMQYFVATDLAKWFLSWVSENMPDKA